VIADSAVLLGPAWIGPARSWPRGRWSAPHREAVSIGIHSAVLENSASSARATIRVVIGKRTVFRHRCQVIGARIGNLCEIGNGSILMSGAVLGDGYIRLNL
jgi:carbonic anhydrase/acetyltransferase-like protein (isoleucine patch superfamily)